MTHDQTHLALALLAAGCSVLAPSPARAQDGAPAPRENRSDEPTAAEDRLIEIIVTAQRRAESLQRTPVSVVALTEKDLESRSLTNTRTLQNFVPNLTFAPSQNVGEAASNVFIRGIGQEDFGVGAEPGVGIYVDGVYFARPLGMIMGLIDTSRIEVLRGPQGTLFGKNTIGGAINVISNMPRERREHRAKLILGSHNRLELRTVSNERLSSKLLARLSIGIVSREGFVRRLPPSGSVEPIEQANRAKFDGDSEGSDRSQSGRLQLRWLVSDTLTADVSLDGTRRRDTQGAIRVDAVNLRAGIFPLLNRLIHEGRLPGPVITEESFSDGYFDSHAGGRNMTRQDLWGASTVLTNNLGGATVKFVGAYRRLKSRVGTDTDGHYFNINGSDVRAAQRQLTGELQVSGARNALSYSAGLFLIDETARLLPAINAQNEILITCGCFFPSGIVPLITTEPRKLNSDSYAGYAQGTYRLTDRLAVTLGARYSHEKKSIDGRAYRVTADLQATDTLLATGSNRDRWSSLTYRAGLEFQATPDLMTYGSIAKGFKSGGFNVRGAPELPNMGFYSFKPETALTYELGLRSQWFERRLRLNATMFHTDYHEIQLRQQTFIDGMLTTLIENAAQARIRGAEVELAAAPLDRLKVSAAYGHLSPRYLDVGTVLGLTDASRFQRTPRHSWTTSIDYALPIRGGMLELHSDYSYRSKEQFQITPAVNDQQGYGLLGARLTYQARDERWALALFGTNLTDQRYRTAGRGTLIHQSGIAYSSVGMPRQLGVQLTVGF